MTFFDQSTVIFKFKSKRFAYVRMLMRYWLKLQNIYIEKILENCGMNDKEMNAKVIN